MHSEADRPAGARASGDVESAAGVGALVGRADLLVLGALFAYAMVFPHAGFEGLVPDNVAQSAYFSLLTRPDLVGSIGSSAPKGGLIVLLGAAHHVFYELLESAWAFKALLAAFYAATIWLVGRIAADVGGVVCGALGLAAALGSSYLTATFFSGSSNLFFMPVVLLGLALLARGRERAATTVLALAITIRPEALLIVGSVIAWRVLPRRAWGRALELSGYAGVAFAFYLLMAYQVQGSWERIGAGSSTGYPAFASFLTPEHLRATLGQLLSERFVALLTVPAAFALLHLPWSRAYLHLFAMVLAFVVLTASGVLAFHYRYIAGAQAVVLALGCGGLGLAVQAIGRTGLFAERRAVQPWFAGTLLALLGVAWWATGGVRVPLTMLAVPAAYGLFALLGSRNAGARARTLGHGAVLALLAGVALLSAVQLRAELGQAVTQTHPAVLDGQEFLALVPVGARVVAEDETLNYVLARRPDVLAGARSIQSVNVMGEAERREALRQASHLYVSLRENHGWNYLFYFPRPEWRDDPLRSAVLAILSTGDPQSLLGVTIAPVHMTDTHLLATVEPL